MKLANGIILEDGRRLDEVIDELEKVKSPNGESVNLTSYVKEDEFKEIKSEIDDLKTKVEGITVPDVSGFVKESELEGYAKITDITALTTTLNQLIADLQAGKYNVSVANGNTTTTTPQ